MNDISLPFPHSRIRLIKKIVADYYDIRVSDIDARKGNQYVADARSVAMYMARELTGESYPNIGMNFDGRDHTTIMAAWRRVKTANVDGSDTRAVLTHLCTAYTARQMQVPAVGAG